MCFLFLAVRSKPTTFHGRFFRSQLDCFQQSWGFVCVCIFFPPELCSHSAFTLSFFLRALMFSFFFGCGEASNGEPYTLYPVFPCSEIHSRRVRCCCCYRCWRFEAVQVSLAATDRGFIDRVWPAAPPNARRLSNVSHSESGAFSRGNKYTDSSSVTTADFWPERVDDDDGSDQERTTVVAVDRCEGKSALSLLPGTRIQQLLLGVLKLLCSHAHTHTPKKRVDLE